MQNIADFLRNITKHPVWASVLAGVFLALQAANWQQEDTPPWAKATVSGSLAALAVLMIVAARRPARHAAEAPFDVLTLTELRERLVDEQRLTMCENTFVPREHDVCHSPDRPIGALFIGLAERGKTREALASVEAIDREFGGRTAILYPRPTTTTVPYVIDCSAFLRSPVDCLVLFWDDLHLACRATERDGSEGLMEAAEARLERLVQQLSARANHFRLVATAREEEIGMSISGLDPESPKGLWSRARLVRLQEFQRSQLADLVRGAAEAAHVSVTSGAISALWGIDRGANPEGIIDFIRDCSSRGIRRITKAHTAAFGESMFARWRRETFDKLESDHQVNLALFRALRCFRVELSGQPAQERLVLAMAAGALHPRWSPMRVRRCRAAMRSLVAKRVVRRQGTQIFCRDALLEGFEPMSRDEAWHGVRVCCRLARFSVACCLYGAFLARYRDETGERKRDRRLLGDAPLRVMMHLASVALLGASAEHGLGAPEEWNRLFAMYLADIRSLVNDPLRLNYAAGAFALGQAYAVAPSLGDAERSRRAVACFEAVLILLRREDNSANWAVVQTQMGCVIQDSGEPGARGRAAVHFEDALDVWTEAANPDEWALCQNGLASGLALPPDPARGDDMRNAISAWRSALRVWGVGSDRERWASTQYHIGLAQLALGAGGGRAALHEAIASFEAALGVLTEDDNRAAWETVRESLASAWEELVNLGSEGDIRRALDFYLAELQTIDREGAPSQWRRWKVRLARAWFANSAEEARKRRDEGAICFGEALATCDREASPREWVAIMVQFGLALHATGLEADVVTAREYWDAALAVPIEGDYEPAQFSALALQARSHECATGKDRRASLVIALQYYQQAIAWAREEGIWEQCETLQSQVCAIENELERGDAHGPGHRPLRH